MDYVSGRPDDAMRQLERSRRWIPELPASYGIITYLNLSFIFDRLGRMEEASRAAQKAVGKSEQEILELSSASPEEYSFTSAENPHQKNASTSKTLKTILGIPRKSRSSL